MREKDLFYVSFFSEAFTVHHWILANPDYLKAFLFRLNYAQAWHVRSAVWQQAAFKVQRFSWIIVTSNIYREQHWIKQNNNKKQK